jgi:membrane-bound lytic murein transglycosylase D
LLKNQLPPREGGYTVKVPAGSQKRITTNLLIAQNVKNKRTIMHKFRKGETLSEVVEKYDVPIAMIKQWNDIQDIHNVQAGQKLTIYLDKEADTESVSSPTIAIDKIVETELPGTIILADSKKMKPNAERNRTENKIAVSYYKVRNGDSLWSIAQKLQVSTREIKRWNSLNNNLLHPGKRLVIKKS